MIRKSIRSSGEESSGNMNWLTTFNDMMTLLMVFFVLLFSMSSLDTKKLKTFQGSLQSGLGVLKEGQRVNVGVHKQPSELVIKSAQPPLKETSDQDDDGVRKFEDSYGPVEKVKEQAEAGKVGRYLEVLASDQGMEVNFTQKGVVVTLKGGLLFPSGTGVIGSAGYRALNKVADMLNQASGPIRIEGHTDNDPIYTFDFPSNWELSTARAVNVVKYLIEKGKIPPQRLTAAGYGASKPLFPNDTPRQKAKNRRVEVVLEMKGAESDE